MFSNAGRIPHFKQDDCRDHKIRIEKHLDRSLTSLKHHFLTRQVTLEVVVALKKLLGSCVSKLFFAKMLGSNQLSCLLCKKRFLPASLINHQSSSLLVLLRRKGKNDGVMFEEFWCGGVRSLQNPPSSSSFAKRLHFLARKMSILLILLEKVTHNPGNRNSPNKPFFPDFLPLCKYSFCPVDALKNFCKRL